MLGVLAAGRPYIALDAGFPAERNALIIADAGACAVIADAEYAGSAATMLRNVPVIAVDDRPRVARTAAGVPPAPTTWPPSTRHQGRAGGQKAWRGATAIFCIGSAASRPQPALPAPTGCCAHVARRIGVVSCDLLRAPQRRFRAYGVAARTRHDCAGPRKFAARRISICHSVPTPVRRIARKPRCG